MKLVRGKVPGDIGEALGGRNWRGTHPSDDKVEIHPWWCSPNYRMGMGKTGRVRMGGRLSGFGYGQSTGVPIPSPTAGLLGM
jgi:hypothetical protein